MSEKKKESITEKKISRRSMLKWTGALAAAVAIGVGTGYETNQLLRPVTEFTTTETVTYTKAEEKSFIQTSIGGLLRVYVRNDRVVRVEPVVLEEEERVPQWVIEARGKRFEQPHEKSLLHAFGLAYRRWVYSPNRLRYPMKRVGWEPNAKSKTYDNRGVGEFVRISWDEAYDLIANEMKRIKQNYGNSAIVRAGSSHKIHGMLGGEGAGTVADIVFNKFGGSTSVSGLGNSWVGHLSGATFVWGNWANIGAYPQDYYYPEGSHMCCFKDLLTDTLKNSNLVVYWSWDGTKIEGFKQGHEFEHHMRWIREAGIKTVSIAPDMNKVSAFHADKWIPIRATTDSAMALAIAYVWFKEDTWNKNWVSTHAVGVEKFMDYVLGKEDGVPKTPEWAEKICAVPAKITRALAREWAKGPTMLVAQICGANRGWYGHEWSRLMHVLQTLQGNIGRPGGNIFNAVDGSPWVKEYHIPYKRDGGWSAVYKIPPNPVTQFIVLVKFADAILNPPFTWSPSGKSGGSLQGGLTNFDPRKKYTYPMPGNSEIKMLFMIGARLHTEPPDIGKLAQVFRSSKIETFWLVNPWIEPLSKYADILLPANTNFERDDLGGFPSATGWGKHRWAVYLQKCIDSLFESKDEVEIYRELGRRLLGVDVLEGRTVEQVLKAIFDWSTISKWITYEEFKKKGYLVIPFPKDYFENYYMPALRWFYEKPVGEGLITPSGKLEIYSKPMGEWYGEKDPEISPIPKWYDPKVMKPNTWGKYPLIGMLDHPTYRYHSMFQDVAWLRELYKVKIDGYEYEPVYINPVDAAARGLKNGDIVRVYNNVGEILCGVRVTEKMIPGVVRLSYGSFYDPVDPRKKSLDRGGSANVLLSDEPMSKHAYGENLAHSPLEIEKWKG